MTRTAQITGLMLLVVIIAMIALGRRLYDESNKEKPASLGVQLIRAIDQRQQAQTAQLLNRGADVNAKEEYSGRTCLMAATATVDQELIKQLLGHGANVDATDNFGRTAFDYLVTSGHATFPVAKLLVPKPSAVRRKQPGGVSTLETAIQSRDTAIVGLVLDSGANPSQTDIAGKPVLISAAEGDDLPTVKALVDHGASVNARGRMKELALATALRLGDEPMAMYLIAHGADVNATAADGAPMLVEAAAGNLPGTVAALLAAGAKPNTPNAAGETALIVAARDGRKRIVEALLKRGADPDAKDKTSRTARQWANEQGFVDIVALIRPQRPVSP